MRAAVGTVLSARVVLPRAFPLHFPTFPRRPTTRPLAETLTLQTGTVKSNKALIDFDSEVIGDRAAQWKAKPFPGDVFFSSPLHRGTVCL